MKLMIIICCIVVLVVVLCLLLCSKGGRHSYYRKKAIGLYDKFNKEPLMSPGQVIGYLRKINPYVFEELIIYAFERKGWKGIRNRRYSGDGGVDGRVIKDGQVYLIQAKRYKRHISLRHIKDFSAVCADYGCNGFFVHTGKTGAASKNFVRNLGNVEIISGVKLYELFVPSQLLPVKTGSMP